MNLLKWHKELSILEKFGFWGSIGSIIGATALFLPTETNGNPQTSYGQNSPNIHSGGDVNINYNSANSVNESFAYIEHPNGGGTMLFNEPTITEPQIVCQPEAGSRIEYISEQAENQIMVWVRVKILTGSCAGQIGWIGKSNYNIHNELKGSE